MSDHDAVSAAAERLWQAAANRSPCRPVRDLIGQVDLDAAYRVARLGRERRLTAGARQTGWKIGLTSEAVQRQLGVDRPDFGVLYEDMAIEDGGDVSLDRLLQPKVEAEVAFVLGEDLDGPTDPGTVRRAIAWAVPALEIVDSRVAEWDITITDTVADNASCGLFVLGDRRCPVSEVDTVNLEMTLRVDGDQVSSGTGAACLGDPVTAAAWLAETAARYGEPLRAGDLILSGALGPMVPARPGTYTAELGGLGTVTATFVVRGDPT